MAEQQPSESHERETRDGVTDEMVRLLGLLRRLEHENASLRRALASRAFAA